jgi:flagellar biosynthetic protein FliR
MGLGIANVFDPSANAQTSLIGQIQVIFALFLFVILDGHHILIRAVAESYALVGPGAVMLRPEGLQFYSGLVGNIFLIGIQIGAPLIVALLAANFSMGLTARSVPQINIFVVGFPFTIWLGLMFLALSFPFFVEALMQLHERLAEVLMMGVRTMG